MSIGRVPAATGGGPVGPHACRVNAAGEPAGAGGAVATARKPQALKAGALPLAFAGLFLLEIGALAHPFSEMGFAVFLQAANVVLRPDAHRDIPDTPQPRGFDFPLSYPAHKRAQ